MFSDEELKVMSWNVLKAYLGQFYVKPLDPSILDKIRSVVSMKENPDYFKSLLVTDLNQIRQVVQFYLLSFGRQVEWACYSSYSFFDMFLQQESFLEVTADTEVVIITHNQNTYTPNEFWTFVNQIIDNRLFNNKYTLFISTNDVKSELGRKGEDLQLSLIGSTPLKKKTVSRKL